MKKIAKMCLVLSLSFLVGCSSKNTAEISKVKPEESDTHIVSTVMGDVEVPTNPERVIANWYIGDAYTLDLNVVGYNAWEQ